MAASKTKAHSTAGLLDPFRALPIESAACGWATAEREYDYWVPEADVVGRIPTDLIGTFFRNGPGISEVGDSKLQHPIDGDGMVCALTFTNGRVHFKSRFVQTSSRVAEQKAGGKLLYRGQMGTNPNTLRQNVSTLASAIITGTPKGLQFRDPSNTNAFLWGNKLLTCYETRLPQCLDPRTLDTLGREDIDGTLREFGAFAAHYRMDSIRDRLVCISLKAAITPNLSTLGIMEYDRSWKLVRKQVHRIPGLDYAHDFAMTENYYIFHITPFVKTTKMLALAIAGGISSPGESMRYYPDRPSRIVAIPRDPARQDAYVAVDCDPCHIFHFATAEERDNGRTIEFTAVTLGKSFNMEFQNKVWLSNAADAPGKLCKFVLDLDAKKCTRTKIDDASCEFPSVHPYRHGMPCRYVWMMASDRKGANVPYRDIVRSDVKDTAHRQVWHSHGTVGEPVFIPRLGYPASIDGGREDDGWIIVQVYIPETHRTEYVILDAARVHDGPVARIRLKHHIPYGFHGTFSPEVFVMDDNAGPEGVRPAAARMQSRL
eukprot:Opistho-2@41870